MDWYEVAISSYLVKNNFFNLKEVNGTKAPHSYGSLYASCPIREIALVLPSLNG